jgi:serine/threonine protein phosphatase 1
VATTAIGDIHGNIDALDDLLDQVAANLTAEDVVVFLGDYIDGGPSSKACIDRVLDFRSCSDATVVTLLGNHEDWLLRTLRDPTRHSWLLGMEAFDTIASYSPAAALELRHAAAEAGAQLLTARTALPYEAFFSCVPKAHVAFFESLVPYHRTSEAIYVHGGLDLRLGSLEQQPVNALVWGADDFPNSYAGEETVIYGHWDNALVDAHGWPWPRLSNRTIGIDTISHGVLTAFRLPRASIFQSRRHPVAGTRAQFQKGVGGDGDALR